MTVVVKLLIALLVLAVWIGATALAAWAVPERGGDEPPDLSVDPHWLNRTPPNPMHYDKVRPGTRATTTTSTTTRHTTPPPNASSTPRNLQSPRQIKAPVAFAAGVEQWRGIVSQYNWPVETMLAIMRCESGGNPLARNRSGASGLFQLLPGPPGWQDPATNVRLAYELKYVPSGLTPWAASRSCWN